jgi:hypothetical protein
MHRDFEAGLRQNDPTRRIMAAGVNMRKRGGGQYAKTGRGSVYSLGEILHLPDSINQPLHPLRTRRYGDLKRYMAQVAAKA